MGGGTVPDRSGGLASFSVVVVTVAGADGVSDDESNDVTTGTAPVSEVVPPLARGSAGGVEGGGARGWRLFFSCATSSA